MRKMINKILNKEIKATYYTLTFLFDLARSLTFATYVLFLLSHGLDFFQVTLVNVAFMAGGLIFEIPTGAYADFFGRKNSIVLSSFIIALGELIYFSSKSFNMFILAEIVCAIGLTFVSGALEAWLVDSLKKQNKQIEVDQAFSKGNIISKSVAIVGGLAGAYFGSVNLAIPFAISAVLLIVVGFVTIFLLENDAPIKQKFTYGEGLKSMIDVAKNSINYGFKHSVVLWLVFASILLNFSLQPINMFWSPRFNELAGDKIWLMGWVWAGFSLFMLIGSYVVRYLLKHNKHYSWILVVTTLGMALPIIFVSYSPLFSVVLVAFLVHQVGRGMRAPITQSYINKHIPSAQRATVLSFDSMMGKLGAVLGLIAFGLIAKFYSIQLSWLVSGLLLLLLIPIYLKSKTNEDLLVDMEV